MICISVTPTSRTLAPADLLNASRHGDLIELCLDHFLKEPDVADLIRMVDKPVLVSCRRPIDGGHWTGSEDQRLHLLRQAIVAGPEYIELDLEIADQIPRFGATRRVISCTSLNRPLEHVAAAIDRCIRSQADVVKVTWRTDDLDAIWPLLAAVTQPHPVPVVGLGLGTCGITFSLMGRKYGCPWVYAALERGMEPCASQPTVWQLREHYRWHEITPRTRFLGIIGFGASENATARVFNAAFERMQKDVRCLPLLPGDLSRLPAMLAGMKINGLVVDSGCDSNLGRFAESASELSSTTGHIDLLMQRSSGWKAETTLLEAVDLAGRTMLASEKWTGRGSVLVCGHGPLARAAARYFSATGAAVSLGAPSDNAASGAARVAGVRFTPWNAVYGLHPDTVILADRDLKPGSARGEVNPMILRERLTLVDLTAYPLPSEFAPEATARGARIIEPSTIFRAQLKLQFGMLAGRKLSDDVIDIALSH